MVEVDAVVWAATVEMEAAMVEDLAAAAATTAARHSK